MTGYPIIDTHVHLWDPNYLNYAWLADVPILNHPYLLEDYGRACGSHQIEKMVFLQCECDVDQYLQEAQWVSSCAADDPRLQGIVAWAPLEKGPAARDDLAALAELPLVKGIRRVIQFEADDQFCLHDDFVRGVQLAGEFDLTFDICIKGNLQMENVIELVRRCPDVRFILDHIGKPDIKDHVMEPWKSQLHQLAAMPNVWCKMSGLVVEADMDSWTPQDLQPYINHVLECFTFRRVMFGGDWPVVVQAAPLWRWIDVLHAAVADCSDDEKNKLFYDNALDFYRLGTT